VTARDRPPTARGRARRERLLDATTELVAARGFHGVGISDIGAAAGVTGSAIYRHFATKTELLVAVLDRVVDGLLDRAEDIVATSDDPMATLDALVDAHVAFALRDRAILQVYSQEAHTLPPDDRRRLRRTQRRYVEHWAVVLVAERPELDLEVARVRVQATFGLVNSVADLSTPLADDELAAVLRASARAALLVAAPSPPERCAVP
jgi:AcrR family transcriptional regulator